MARAIDIVRKNESKGPSVWKEEAIEQLEQWDWMRYTMQIALKVRSSMRRKNMTQCELASKVGCTQQYVSLLLRGKENLTLETISKLERALGISLINIVVESSHSYRNMDMPHSYLSDSETTPGYPGK